jgi:hypothetical protein
MYTIYDIGIPGPGLRQAHKYWGVKHVNGIPPPLLIVVGQLQAFIDSAIILSISCYYHVCYTEYIYIRVDTIYQCVIPIMISSF